MHHAALLGKLAGLVSIVGIVPYVRSMLRGDTKPNRAGWFIWACVSTAVLISYHFSGATTTIWLSISFAIIPIMIFLLSIKYGVGGLTRLDIICLIGAVVGLALWKLTRSPEIALYINVAVDFLGFVPTIKKAYLQPETENALAWNISVVANLLNILALTTWQFKIAFYPVYLLLTNVVVALLITGPTRKLLLGRGSAWRSRS